MKGALYVTKTAEQIGTGRLDDKHDQPSFRSPQTVQVRTVHEEFTLLTSGK